MQTIPVIEPCTRHIIRFQDFDPFGHLNNARYLDYLISAREDHLSQFYQFDLPQFLQSGFGWVVGQHEIVYHRPARYYEPVWIQTSLITFTERFLQVEAVMWNEEKQQVKALLWTKYHYVNTTGQKAVHSAELMTLFAELQNDKIAVSGGIASRLTQLLQKPVTS